MQIGETELKDNIGRRNRHEKIIQTGETELKNYV